MLTLNDSIDKVPLIGPRNKALLSVLEIHTVHDLLYHFPFRYEDFSIIRKISNLIASEPVTVIGDVISIKNIFTRNGKNFAEGVVSDETGKIKLYWFNQPYLARSFKAGDRISFSGKLEAFSGKPAFIGPDFEILKSDGIPIHTGRLVPIYPETQGVSSKWLRSRIHATFDLLLSEFVTEFLPLELRQTEELIAIDVALKQIHFPDNLTSQEAAKKRLAFDEVFLVALEGLIRRETWKVNKLARQLKYDASDKAKINRFVDALPFKLTKSQQQAVDEINSDLVKNEPMNRLLEGDVGSGKTIVAAISAYLTVLNGASVLYMAPTEILANQHYETFKKLFDPLSIEIKIMTGSRKSESSTNNNKPTIIIGTHALLYRQNFDNIALAIIDEQHRFGVEQRTELLNRSKAENGGVPHLLTMTATPIPRSLQLTVMGDLDLSAITEMPVGRKPVTTWVVPKSKRDGAYAWLKKENQPTFIIFPFIDESLAESLKTVKAATKEFELLKKSLKPLKVGLLHGRMSSTDKDKVIADFREHRVDVLVSTPVVEVGVDIPEASIIVIEGAERFGLASLHQLRGRVGRGGQQAYCLLFTSDGDSDTRRLKALEIHHNGLELAKIDLAMRGGGELYGTLQSGDLGFKLADPSDVELLINARDWAQRILADLNKYTATSKLITELKTKKVGAN